MDLEKIDLQIREIKNKNSPYACINLLNDMLIMYENIIKNLTEKININEKIISENISNENIVREDNFNMPDIFDDIPLETSQINISVDEIRESKKMKRIEDRTINMKENYLAERKIIQKTTEIIIPKEINRLINEYRKIDVVRNEISVLPENNFEIDEPHSMESFNDELIETVNFEEEEFNFTDKLENKTREEKSVLFFNFLLSLNENRFTVFQPVSYGNIKCIKNKN